jgi:hypothetical protein
MKTSGDPFNVVGARRGGGQKSSSPDTLPAEGLARFSLGYTDGVHLSEGSQGYLLAILNKHAEDVLQAVAVFAAAEKAGWESRVGTAGGKGWISLSKYFVTCSEAAEEIQGFGAEDQSMDFFPSGSPQDREGYDRALITPKDIFYLGDKPKQNKIGFI